MRTSSSHYHRSVLMHQFTHSHNALHTNGLQLNSNSKTAFYHEPTESNCYCMCFYSLFYCCNCFVLLYSSHQTLLSLSLSPLFWPMICSFLYSTLINGISLLISLAGSECVWTKFIQLFYLLIHSKCCTNCEDTFHL